MFTMYRSSSFSLIVIMFTSLIFISISSLQTPKHYVVYMGSSIEADVHNSEAYYLQMLDTLLPREESERRKGVHQYKHAFRGFSAMLTEEEAAALSGHDEVVSVFEDPMLQLHTTRSWDFLDSLSGASSSFPIYNSFHGSSDIIIGVVDTGHDEVVSVFEDPMLQLHTTRSWDFLDSLSGVSSSFPIYNSFHGSSDIIIGVVDTGIWPESSSFSDKGFGEIPSKWKGICMEGPDFNSSNCNRKLIGARYYKSTGATSARDSNGHGTHTASTAAGAHVVGASDRGLARGTAKGGQPGCRIAAYKTCTADGCSGSAMLKAMDDAVHDGVDIISISIGSNAAFTSDYLSDPIAIGAFHAELKGIMVIASAGNDGPNASTVTNVAPWLFTVAASNIDRDFQSSVILGSGKVIRGAGIHFSNATRPKTYSLVYARNAAAASKPAEDARPVTNTSGLTSTPHETGAGEISPQRAINPGLVFETTTQDYLQFLCYYGYSQKTISKTLTKATKFSCPKKTSKDLISDINYPSISIGNLRRGQRKMIKRSVTNVGLEKNVTYVAHIEAPEGLVVKVAPKRLVFGENVHKVSFKVWFYGEKSASKRYHHGSLEWSDGYHSVRSVFSVNIN
ncbi:hypothetical protein F2Q68_00027535 [Brassica cretica]|uniref:Inhibitor I9 domain-containing protein n=1 Tax=Brassica cretica TaxID=69181 RepID=A0A8S9IF92_BRACR|nr:hypothetical protein F2Q68_00027535 [Brassica cretica]